MFHHHNMETSIREAVTIVTAEIKTELKNILSYWIENTVDEEKGGFYGKINHDNVVDKNASKGAVLNTRILWTFSAAYRLTGNKAYNNIADRAYQYILDYFIDKERGGVFWSVDAFGNALDTKKQIYAQAFAVYSLSEYNRATGNAAAKEAAIKIYGDIVQHSYDAVHGGYIEALTEDWKDVEDLRLSSKDKNEKKSMNTHLHLLEGFANLYRVWPDEELKERIKELICIFFNHIIHPHTYHLQLFFDEAWRVKSNEISYGHDIEAAWLIQEGAEIIKDEKLINKAKHLSVKLAAAAARGLDDDGGLWHEKNEATGHLVKEKHWWPQAEALVGFYNAAQLTGEESFYKKFENSWAFIKNHILHKEGEWVWGVNEDYSIMKSEDKAGFWKCPYHNARACIEIINRTKNV